MSSNNNANLCDQCKSVGLPIMPVRYAVAPKAVQPGLPAWADGNRVKDVPLGEDFHYALRTLREGYVYLFYSKNARGSNQWECYTVGQDGCLRLQPDPRMARPQEGPTFACSRQGHTNTALHYLVIERPEKCGPTWIAFSETKWSDETIQEYTANTKLRNARMQTLHPAQMATGAKHSHGAIAEAPAIEQVIEYAPAFTDNQLPYQSTVADFSKEDGSYTASQLTKMSTRYPWRLRKGEAENVVKHMKLRGKGPKGDATPHVLALWDGIGIAHELNGFRNDAAGWIKRYGDERELQITALNAIEGAKQALANKQRANLGDHKRRVMSGAAFKDTMRVKPNPRGWPDNARWVPFTEREDILKHGTGMGYVVLPDSHIDNAVAHGWEKYEAKLEKGAKDKFKQKWDALLTATDQIIDRRTETLVKWLEAPLFIDTLEDFHPSNIEDGVMFEDVVGEAIFGIGSTKAGHAKLDAWIKEAKASVKSNLLWRAVALNQQEGIADVDAALQTAFAQTTPLTVAAWNVAMTNLKNLQRLADTYKKAQGVYDGNVKAGNPAGSSAFGVRLKPIQTRGVDRIVITAGDAIFRAFRIDKAGDFVSEKIIQHMFCVRAYVDPMDSLRLVTAQAKEQKLTNAQILRRINTAKGFLGINPPEGESKKGVSVPRSQQAGSLAEAWEDVKKNSGKGPAAIKDARLAVVVMLIESGNFAKLIAESKGDAKAYAMIAASGMSITAAAIDIASVPAKNIWGNEAATYQKLKLFGGLLSGAASLLGAGVDLTSTVSEIKKERWGLAALYGMKTTAGLAGGLLAGATAFSYGAGVLYKISGRTALTQAARATGAAATRIIAARIFMMSVGAWITVITIGLQVLIWVFTPDDLEDWCEGCTFGPKSKRKGWNPKQQMEEFDKALVEVL